MKDKRIIRTGDFKFSDEERAAVNELLDEGRITEHNRTRKT